MTIRQTIANGLDVVLSANPIALIVAAGLLLGAALAALILTFGGLSLNTQGSSVGVNVGSCGVYVGTQTGLTSGPYVEVGNVIAGTFCGDH